MTCYKNEVLLTRIFYENKLCPKILLELATIDKGSRHLYSV